MRIVSIRTPPSDDDGEFFDVAEFMARYHVSKKFVYDGVKSGRIPAVRFGRSIRFNPAAVREWLEHEAAFGIENPNIKKSSRSPHEHD